MPKPYTPPYPYEFKQEVLNAYLNRGDLNGPDIAREYGIAYQTLYNWIKASGSQRRSTTRGRPKKGTSKALPPEQLKAALSAIVALEKKVQDLQDRVTALERR